MSQEQRVSRQAQCTDGNCLLKNKEQEKIKEIKQDVNCVYVAVHFKVRKCVLSGAKILATRLVQTSYESNDK